MGCRKLSLIPALIGLWLIGAGHDVGGWEVMAQREELSRAEEEFHYFNGAGPVWLIAAILLFIALVIVCLPKRR